MKVSHLVLFGKPQDAKKKKELKVKLQMAAFLQDTIEEMAVTSKNPKKVESVQEFADFIKRVCKTIDCQKKIIEFLRNHEYFWGPMFF